SMMVGALSFLPGGLGGAEATMVALLILNDVAQPQAVAATVLIRLATLWFAVGLGVVALMMPERRKA
ncbi:MAG: lysylphosphatidylglycerol synthase domain-containing protein, partial [Gallionella sp.]